MSDRVAVMMDGELLQVAPPAALYDRPADLRVAEFVGSPKINVLPGTVRADGGVDVPGGALAIRGGLSANTVVSVGVRREQCDVAWTRRPTASAAGPPRRKSRLRLLRARRNRGRASAHRGARRRSSSRVPPGATRDPAPAAGPRAAVRRRGTAAVTTTALPAGGRTDDAPVGPGARRGDGGLRAERARHGLPAGLPAPAARSPWSCCP